MLIKTDESAHTEKRTKLDSTHTHTDKDTPRGTDRGPHTTQDNQEPAT